jgi:uncharacterized membrane protein YjfL (UPF0719 family)
MLAIPSPTLVAILLWFLRTFLSCIFCLLIGLGGIAVLDKITVKIHEFKAIRGHAEATALFVGGFLIFAGLVVHGSVLNPIFFGQQILISSFINIQRFLVVSLSVLMCLLFGWIFYVVFAKVTPFHIDLDDINKSPTAVGAFMFCYEVFMGLVINASLSIPL